MSRWHGLIGYVVALVTTSLATLVIAIVDHYVSIPNLSLLYVLAILGTAISFGTWPSLAAATLAALEYDFFLLPPAFTLTILQLQDVLAFTVFVIVAMLTSQLAARARAQAEAARRRAAESTTLYELGQALMSASDINAMLYAITQRVVSVFHVDRCAIYVPENQDHLQLAAEAGCDTRPLGRAASAAASWVFREGAEVGLPDSVPLDAMPQSSRAGQRLYIPLRTADSVVGVMEVGRKRTGEGLDVGERRLLTSFAAQAALVIARAQAEEERQRLKLIEESDQLKSALLSAVSHDLRTPLASIKASATSLLLADASWTSVEGRELLETIDTEADRLNRLVGNLLDLSRIEAGVLRPVRDWYDIREVIDTARRQMRSLLEDRLVTVEVPEGLPLVHIDFVLIVELITNLLENAAKHTPPQTPITVRVGRQELDLHIAVVDHGSGVPAEQRERIFDRFYRVRRHSDRDRGTGLGLAICRGIAEAHGGTIGVEETPGGGATFIVTLPLAVAAEMKI
jgi:two-component system sensor histidine kinase KdpD